jgi:sortase A
MRKIRFVEILAWVVGVALVAIWAGARLHGTWGSRTDLRRFEQAKESLQGSAAPGESLPGTADLEPPLEELVELAAPVEVDTSLWAKGRIEGYEESLRQDLGAAQAILRIPKLSLEVAVLEGTSEPVLNRGVGRIEGTARVGAGGNLGLAGHRDGFFRGLKDVEIGDAMELETLTGTQTYIIDQISIVSPEDVYVLNPSAEPRITLVTCYPFYFVGKAPLRFIVHGREATSGDEIARVAPAPTL